MENKWWKIRAYEVFTNGENIVITGEPSNEDCYSTDEICNVHNCDEMGCGTLEHIILRATLSKRQSEIATLLKKDTDQKAGE